ncbi:hypothetical protein MTsPCn9_18260 [Croceitalea sp. MTPC9]|uniref:DUF1569 domain-containing protein n=1 Tax=unclassified Croceitalea TaxID=2632280 RepID=UPI002B36B7AF|nr:hypothetical protein MTsPCn6_11110 [Croceitalea sp. MTPC6]GMN16890.1 hypothetical protein MTsPCn9_18260 [Croceitalea sp. MTPC9]
MKKAALMFGVVLIGLIVLVQWNNKDNSVDFLDNHLAEIERLFEKRNVSNPEVSQASVSWHLDHSLKTINRISEQLIQSKPKDYSSSFSFQRVVVHTTGVIPRGVAQSPQNVRPPDVILLDSLKIQLEEVKNNIKKINLLDKNTHFEHPVFKTLDKGQTKRFLAIHTNHHLKIIRDILEQ